MRAHPGQLRAWAIERQHSEIDQVVTTIKQMACSVKQITRNATTTAVAAQCSHGAAQESEVVTAGRLRGATVLVEEIGRASHRQRTE
ncbi:hypothetical protein TMM008_04650 [Pseudomonas sp. 008]|nr:hypothetical protein TMM008_04650 [Pseudomonas sp. 008]